MGEKLHTENFSESIFGSNSVSSKSFHLQVYHFMPSSRVLVCTPSNSAADLICIRLHDSGFLHAASLARVNASCRQNEVSFLYRISYF